MPRMPKLEEKLSQRIVTPNTDQLAHNGYGIVMSYDSQNNTATVLMANRGSDEPGQIFSKVPCPTQVGVQSTSPEIGRPCQIMFKDSNYAYPMISSFFNHAFNVIDYQRHYNAVNSLPRYMFNV